MTSKVWIPYSVITWMSGFTKVAPCTWTNGKISGLLLLCKQRENTERFCVNSVSSQIFQPVEIKHVNEISVWHMPHACNVFYTAAGVVPGSLMFYSMASWGFPEVNILFNN